jgi:signal transduction histidine kinase
VGQLRLAQRRGAPFTPADRQLLRELARQAGPAVHAVRLTTALRRSRERLISIQEEERRRIQRDLHDGLGPTIASVRFRIEACLDQAQRTMPELVAELERLDELVGQAISEIRRLVNDLRPHALDQLGLTGALRQHVERVRRETELEIVLELQAPPQLPAALEVTLFRVVQEALVNVTKYAQATRATVRLAVLGDALLLHIHDNGVGGATLGRTPEGGHGLSGIAERAELLGGSLSLRSVVGAGTTLELYLPLREANDER